MCEWFVCLIVTEPKNYIISKSVIVTGNGVLFIYLPGNIYALKTNSHLSNAENDRCIWLKCVHEKKVRQLPLHMYLFGRQVSVFDR